MRSYSWAEAVGAGGVDLDGAVGIDVEDFNVHVEMDVEIEDETGIGREDDGGGAVGLEGDGLEAEGEGQSELDGDRLRGDLDIGKAAGHGEVECESRLIVLNMGDPLTGINWTNRAPKMNYEIALDAMRVTGSDFFCGLTVPVGDSFCSLIVGGWGGGLVGISSLDGMDASENETTKFLNVEQGKWYRIRMRVTQSRIEAWIDKEKFVNVDTTDKKISVRPGDIESSKPFGIASYQTTAALREIKLRRVLTPANPTKKQKE